MIKPYNHQEKPLEVCLDIMKQEGPTSKIVVAPTAFGKTILVAFVSKYLMDNNIPTLIIQPSKELLMQNYEMFMQVGLSLIHI